MLFFGNFEKLLLSWQLLTKTLHLLKVFVALKVIICISLVSFFFEQFIGTFWGWNLHFPPNFQEIVESETHAFAKSRSQILRSPIMRGGGGGGGGCGELLLDSQFLFRFKQYRTLSDASEPRLNGLKTL